MISTLKGSGLPKAAIAALLLKLMVVLAVVVLVDIDSVWAEVLRETAAIAGFPRPAWDVVRVVPVGSGFKLMPRGGALLTTATVCAMSMACSRCV